MNTITYCTNIFLFTGDRPLVAQFAASNARDFGDASLIVAPFVDAVDLNCGCPQRWVKGVL